MFSGGHDDYGPEAIFTNRKAAIRFRKFHMKNDDLRMGRTEVEEWPIDLPRPFWVEWIVRFNQDMSVASVEKYVDGGRSSRAFVHEKPFKDSEGHVCVALKVPSRKEAIAGAKARLRRTAS